MATKTEPQVSKATRVLIVDDSAMIRDLIFDVLSEDARIEVVGEADDGLTAVQMATALLPDVITLDINMPMLNGFEAAETIRTISPSIRVVFVSGESGPESVQRAYRSGASGYVVKTELGTQLLPVIHALVENPLSHLSTQGVGFECGAC